MSEGMPGSLLLLKLCDIDCTDLVYVQFADADADADAAHTKIMNSNLWDQRGREGCWIGGGEERRDE